MKLSSPDPWCTLNGTRSRTLSTGSWRPRTPSPGRLSPSPPPSSSSCLSSSSSSSIWSGQKTLGLGKVQKGTMVLIPKRGDVDPKSIIHSHQDFMARGNGEDGGFNHPAIVIDILPGDILECLQVTSFAGQGANVKWHKGPGAQKRRALYLEIDHSNDRDLDDEATDDEGRPILRLCNKHTRMLHASFVNCERMFSIGRLNVSEYRNGSHRLREKDLDRIQEYRSELLKQGLISDNNCSTLTVTTGREPQDARPTPPGSPKYRQIMSQASWR